MFKKIWDIKWDHDGWQVICLLHGERYSYDGSNPATSLANALKSAEYLNEQENSPKLTKTVTSHDLMDVDRTYVQVWCHGGKSKGHNMSGWYEPTEWTKNNFKYVGERL